MGPHHLTSLLDANLSDPHSWQLEQPFLKPYVFNLTSTPRTPLPPGPQPPKGGKWYLAAKHYLSQTHARVTALALHNRSGTLAVGFSTGVFELYLIQSGQGGPAEEVDRPTCLHTLSVSRERITSLAFNYTGDWLAGERLVGV